MSVIDRFVPVLVVASCVVIAGCSTPPENGGNAYAQDKVTTGSNIPKKGQAAVVDGSVLQDQINRGSGGAAPR